MFDILHPGASLGWDYLWQSTVFLGLGLAASALLVRQPARAHRLLLLLMLASVGTPLLAQAARFGGWGMLAPKVERPLQEAASSTITLTQLGVREEPARLAFRSSPLSPTDATAPARDDRSLALPISAPRAAGSPARESRDSPLRSPLAGMSRISYRGLWVSAWLTLTGIATARLVASILFGVAVARRSDSLSDAKLSAAAARAAVQLGVGRPLELRSSPRVRCPAIWCWRRTPLILMPPDSASVPFVDWVAVFTHELAHWIRRDHLWGVAAELLTCLLPWHPLAWWARQRLGQLSELACDDWALSTGLPALDYADSLLELLPQRRRGLALTAVSSRYGLIGRVRHILDPRRASPVVGSRWALATTAAMIVTACAIALAQTRPASPKGNGVAGSNVSGTASATSKASASSKTGIKRVITGTVTGPDGRPSAGADVWWIGQRKPPVPHVALPKDHESTRSSQAEILTSAKTDAAGRFALSAAYDPESYQRYNGWDVTVLAKARGAGMLSQRAKGDATELNLRLPREVRIHGRLLTPGGTPASGVRVTLSGWFNDQTQDGMYVGLTATDAEIPAYWPQARQTDANGEFVLEGVPEGTYLSLAFWHPDYAVDDVTVNTTGSDSLTPGLRAFEIAPVKPSFTHTLEPARPVQGRVTDEQTGRPLAGLLVEMIPMRSHGGMPFHGRTDADGRYRISGHGGARFYSATVFPPADSGYLAATANEDKWPAGARFLAMNFALKKGRIVRGRVIDSGNNQPVVGAAVVYQPKRGNPNDRNYDLRNTTLTDADGRFAITALPGQGFLAVETSDANYMRVPVRESNRFQTLYPQGFLAIDVANNAEPKPVEVTLRKGVPLEAKAIGPDGKVVADLVGYCEGIDARLVDVWNQGQPFEDGVFRLPGADPLHTYRIYFIQPERRIGAVVDLKPGAESKPPVEVKLQPTAKVHGMLKSKSGTPISGAQVYPMLVTRDKDGQMTRDEVFRNTLFYSNVIGQKAMLAYSDRQRSSASGEFVVDTLLPGVRLYIMGAAGDREARILVKPLEPGEDRDLGTITFKEREP
jgi:beta-lactamase regulating signal transducer with metallopeptidase domain